MNEMFPKSMMQQDLLYSIVYFQYILYPIGILVVKIFFNAFL